MPSQRRAEVAQTKTEMKQYQELKNQRQFIKRRSKLIKSGWRNGIVGIEMPNEEGSLADCSGSVFYRSN